MGEHQKTKQTEEITFEAAMGKIEEIVGRLEEGDVPLEEAVALFQEGMNLSKTCHQKLQKVEEKMDRILKENGEIEELSIQEDNAT